MGDAGAVLAVAPDYRLGVGPVSSRRWGEGRRQKKANESNPTLSSLFPILRLTVYAKGRTKIHVVICNRGMAAWNSNELTNI